MLFCPALTDQISLFEFWLYGVRRNLVICYCQEGVDKACSEFTCDSSTPYSLPSSGPRALLNSVGFCMADLLPLPCSPVLSVEHRSSFIDFCSHQASVCVLLWYVEYLVFLWPHIHIFLLGSLYLLSEEEKQKYNLKVENYALFGGQDGRLKFRRQDLSSKELFHRGKWEATLSNTLAWRIPWTE